MKTLLILRHAKSSWKDENLPDHERPLNRRGKLAAPRAGEWLRQEALLPDIILSSTAVRAHQTAELAAAAGGYIGEIRLVAELYAAGPEAYLQAVANLEDRFERVMVVGHNPGLEELVSLLSGVSQPMPTAALACVKLEIATWGEIGRRPRGVISAIWRPKDDE